MIDDNTRKFLIETINVLLARDLIEGQDYLAKHAAEQEKIDKQFSNEKWVADFKKSLDYNTNLGE